MTRHESRDATERSIPGFRGVFTVIGVVYTLMALSGLGQGVSMLRDFGVSEPEIASRVLADFFSFFYELMAYVGVLMVILGWVTRGRAPQILVSVALFVANLLFALRDLQTSDSPFGDHLYRGEATLAFVLVDLTIAASFGALALVGAWRTRREPLTKRPDETP